MTDTTLKTLPCGCAVRPYRDFLGRGVGEITTKGADCADARHAAGQVVLMPGRENARPE